jgi:hypothetical protein
VCQAAVMLAAALAPALKLQETGRMDQVRLCMVRIERYDAGLQANELAAVVLSR